MIFGKIEYLNLLPFHIFMKRFTKGSSAKMSMEYKKNVPSQINKAFHKQQVDAAFISSISAKNSHHIGLGIIAKKEVQSVLIIPNTKNKDDAESASSNALAKILKLDGEVLIGDKALRYALQNSNYIDLAKEWYKSYKLPFVFALLCYHKDKNYYKKIELEFLKQEVKIPQYILKKYAQKTSIKESDILHYLKLISYKLDAKTALSIKKFYKLAQEQKFL
jgi:chorismate dehydratase